MVSQSSKRSLKTMVVLSRAYRSLTDVTTKDIESHKLNPTEFAVLELIYHKGDQPLQQIGDKILMASGSITYVVDKLEKKELVKRVPCPKDRRVIYATITEKGKAFMDKAFPQHEEVIDEYMKSLTTDEKEQLIYLLKKLSKIEEKKE